MSKGNLQTQQRLLGFVHGLGGTLKKRPLVLSQDGAMSNAALAYNLGMLVQKGLLIREPDAWVVPEAKAKRRAKVNRRIHIVGSVSTDKPSPALDTEEAGASQVFYTVEVSAELVELSPPPPIAPPPPRPGLCNLVWTVSLLRLASAEMLGTSTTEKILHAPWPRSPARPRASASGSGDRKSTRLNSSHS